MNEKLRYVLRFVKDSKYASCARILQLKTDKGWEDVDLNSIDKDIPWETPKDKEKYEKAYEREIINFHLS